MINRVYLRSLVRSISTVISDDCYLNKAGTHLWEVVLNRPNVRNALGKKMIEDLNGILDTLESVPS